ncbi:MAG: FG-GAP repeat protein, partial [Deltaproteobacteria bacterium]|nr:FG-GAP repeat protein [Deltaproteobacteria bacterium]
MAIVGAYGKDEGGSDRGAAYVFYRNQNGNDLWGQVAKLTASDAEDLDEFGAAVAVNGTTAIVGARGEDGGGSDRGAAYVFYRDKNGNDLWGEVVKVGANDDQNWDAYGCAVDLDGDIAIIGSQGDNSSGQDTGAAYVLYRHNNGNDAWGEEKKLLALDKQGGDLFGLAVAISGDTAVVGAPQED